MEQTFSCFATCTRGAETYLADELTQLGASNSAPADNGVTFEADKATLYKVCLWSRLSSRVLLTVADDLRADTPEAIYQACKKIEWEQHLSTLNTFSVHAIGSNPNIRHSGFLALKIKDAIVDRIRNRIGKRPNVSKDDPDIHIMARLHNNKLSVSLDVSGDALHRRMWRQSGGAAPLKETLAALMLHVSGYNGTTPFFDPLCGSGTICIEAAEAALGLACGRRRHFGIERWPTTTKIDRRQFRDLKQQASQPRRKSVPPIIGWDIDPAQIKHAERNLAAAGLGEHVSFLVKDARTGILPDDALHIVTNVPYGERMDAPDEDLQGLYAALDKNWYMLGDATITVLSPGTVFRKSFTLAPDKSLELKNGPLAVMLYRYKVGRAFKK